MKNRLLITIADINGTKSYNVHKILKKLLIIIIIFILILFISSMYFINNLTNKVEQLNIKEKKLLSQSKAYSNKIKNKIKDIEELSSKLDDIEEIIGLNPLEYKNEIQRVNLVKTTSQERKYILQIIPNSSPIKNYDAITSRFGYRIHPMTKKKKYHRGIDFRAKRNTPVFTTADGVVRYVQAKNKGSFGRVVVISHNYGFETLYAHLKKTKVKIGDVVKKGETIALSGNSGRSSGPHLHYEIKYGVRSLNPDSFLKWDIKTYEKIFKKEKRVPWKALLRQIKLHKN